MLGKHTVTGYLYALFTFQLRSFQTLHSQIFKLWQKALEEGGFLPLRETVDFEIDILVMQQLQRCSCLSALQRVSEQIRVFGNMDTLTR